MDTIILMPHLWDYDQTQLKKSKQGRLLMLERLINYGIYRKGKEKISLCAVKKNWENLQIEDARKRLLRFLIWGK